jgi:hypothetical protein
MEEEDDDDHKTLTTILGFGLSPFLIDFDCYMAALST